MYINEREIGRQGPLGRTANRQWDCSKGKKSMSVLFWDHVKGEYLRGMWLTR